MVLWMVFDYQTVDKIMKMFKKPFYAVENGIKRFFRGSRNEASYRGLWQRRISFFEHKKDKVFGFILHSVFAFFDIRGRYRKIRVYAL